MEQWEDQAIILGSRAHGENGAVVTLLSENYGRHAGYVNGGQSRRMRGLLEPGSLVDVGWKARTIDSLGSFRIEQQRHSAGALLDDPLRFAGLMAACAICRESLPERETHAGIFHGFLAMIESLESELWGATYVLWEIALLRELGFAIRLDRCAGGGSTEDLIYVSPKSGQAVSREAGEPYKEKLLPLAAFLRPQRGEASAEEVLKGIEMTAYFFEHWVFAQHTRGIPEERLRFGQRFAKYVEQQHAESLAQDRV